MKARRPDYPAEALEALLVTGYGRTPKTPLTARSLVLRALAGLGLHWR